MQKATCLDGYFFPRSDEASVERREGGGIISVLIPLGVPYLRVWCIGWRRWLKLSKTWHWHFQGVTVLPF